MESGAGGAALGSVSALPPFLTKTYDMVDDPATDAVVSWGKASNSFVVWNIPEFARELLPKYFKHSNFSSFVRQLNTYGFRKVDPDHWEFANEGFLRGYKHLMKSINRRKPSHAQCQQQPAQAGNPSVSSCIDVGDFGIEEVVDGLKRDKNVLMQELVRLRQLQQSTDHQLHTVDQRVHSMEQRQQQMMSFLATAMHSPGFVTQLVHQQTESSRQISGGNKKRKLPNEDEENLAHKYDIMSPDGQIVKYQPLMNEAAKAMLRQILIMDKSGMLESQLSDTNGFLIDKAYHPSNILDGGSSSSSMSGVSLSKAAPNTASLTKIQSSAISAHEKPPCTMLPKTHMGLPNIVPHQLISPGRNVNLHDGQFKELESADLRCSGSVPGFVNTTVPVASDEILADDDLDISVDDAHKLPGINDVFWEQFLSDNPFGGDIDEINDVDLEHDVGTNQKMDQESEWDKLTNLNNLTEQMSLIAATSNSG